ncbi:hypothetical protein HMPREF0658_2032 [Hoylesella marshii DSM 16973 = JCM 13450]|uniref:Uncharacterized protein n=1 Tax=Hoylesella marshii DSM 16973 = JCM 13450 TaxID=862515 RepID=E0NV27_9BACT|nr:hypothetical protein HMPREF0658_2032 [Hoylesella marshii DSM 16973 = JCM 13450]
MYSTVRLYFYDEICVQRYAKSVTIQNKRSSYFLCHLAVFCLHCRQGKIRFCSILFKMKTVA